MLNNIHFIHDDEEGHSLLHMLQQRAEAWWVQLSALEDDELTNLRLPGPKPAF